MGALFMPFNLILTTTLSSKYDKHLLYLESQGVEESGNFIPSCKTYLWLSWFGPSTVIGVTVNKIDLAPVFTELHSQRVRGTAGSCDSATWREHHYQNGHRAT